MPNVVTSVVFRSICTKFPTQGQTPEDFLIAQAQQGLEKRLASLFPDAQVRQKKYATYQNRLDRELAVINQMGFPGYTIVMEFIQWAKQHGIAVGPGRGSGAGSLVAYALDITDLDPLQYDLLLSVS